MVDIWSAFPISHLIKFNLICFTSNYSICLSNIYKLKTGEIVPLSPTAPISYRLYQFRPSASLKWPVWWMQGLIQLPAVFWFNTSHSRALIGLRESALVRSDHLERVQRRLSYATWSKISPGVGAEIGLDTRDSVICVFKCVSGLYLPVETLIRRGQRHKDCLVNR